MGTLASRPFGFGHTSLLCGIRMLYDIFPDTLATTKMVPLPTAPTAANSLSEEDTKEHGEFPDTRFSFLGAVVQVRAEDQAAAFY